MKRLLLCLIPWMVTMAAASEATRPAEVVYTHVGATTGDVFRVDDECFIDPALTAPWGWSVQVTNNLADVQAEGQRFKIPIRWLNGKKLLPLRASLKHIDGGSAWRPGTDTLEVFGLIRSLDSMDGKIVVESTLAVKPKVFFLKNPSRIVVDLAGGRMDEKTRIAIGPGGRAGQWKPNIVRVVQESEHALSAPSYNPTSTRAFSYDITANHGGTPEGHVQPKEEEDNPIEQQVRDPQPDVTVRSAPPVSKIVRIGKPQISEKGNRAEMRIGLSGTPPQPAKFRRVDANVLEIVLPGAGVEEPEKHDLKSQSVESVEVLQENGATILRIKTLRPAGVEFSTAAGELRVNLIKPDVGDGRLSGKTIVVDAGHGGHDGGAHSGGSNEKTLTLAISKRLAEHLAAQGATVIMTRKTDVFLPLKERSEIANRNGADLFISVHINSNRRPNSTSGSITFYHKRDPIGQLLAECVQREIGKVSKLPSIGTWSDTRIYNSGFAVLRYAKMPAILLELGFINHSTDRRRMTTADFQDSVAKAIVRGIRIYLGDVKAEEIESK